MRGLEFGFGLGLDIGFGLGFRIECRGPPALGGVKHGGVKRGGGGKTRTVQRASCAGLTASAREGVGLFNLVRFGAWLGSKLGSGRGLGIRFGLSLGLGRGLGLGLELRQGLGLLTRGVARCAAAAR